MVCEASTTVEPDSHLVWLPFTVAALHVALLIGANIEFAARRRQARLLTMIARCSNWSPGGGNLPDHPGL